MSLPCSTSTIASLMANTSLINCSLKVVPARSVEITSIKSTEPTKDQYNPSIYRDIYRYEEVLGRVKEPTLAGFVEDNLPRLLLNRKRNNNIAFDRLIAAFQAYPTLKARFTQPGTFSHTFTEILNEGVILGAFKGFIFNFAQLALVLYPSVYFANKS